ncbi:hypothetical protein [Streptomyces sp. NPDC047070]|uniref:hypothetical protein n=1 Tax=Streptomyces sp. NPDC047070 TaxID=3154923 RepID=UPI003451A5B7
MNTLCRRLGFVVRGVRRGRHSEVYVLFLLGLVLVGPGQFDGVDSQRPLQFIPAVVTAALALLVFRTAAPSEPAPTSADDEPHGRQDLGPLRSPLEHARDPRVHGPVTINVPAGADGREASVPDSIGSAGSTSDDVDPGAVPR